jgi:hypothetical protein
MKKEKNTLEEEPDFLVRLFYCLGKKRIAVLVLIAEGKGQKEKKYTNAMSQE